MKKGPFKMKGMSWKSGQSPMKTTNIKTSSGGFKKLDLDFEEQKRWREQLNVDEESPMKTTNSPFKHESVTGEAHEHAQKLGEQSSEGKLHSGKGKEVSESKFEGLLAEERGGGGKKGGGLGDQLKGLWKNKELRGAVTAVGMELGKKVLSNILTKKPKPKPQRTNPYAGITGMDFSTGRKKES